jgi:hypothetical protein
MHILPFLRQSVLFLMCTIFDYPVINHLTTHPFSFSHSPGYPAPHSPWLAEPFYINCWTALHFKELLSTIYLASITSLL